MLAQTACHLYVYEDHTHSSGALGHRIFHHTLSGSLGSSVVLLVIQCLSCDSCFEFALILSCSSLCLPVDINLSIVMDCGHCCIGSIILTYLAQGGRSVGHWYVCTLHHCHNLSATILNALSFILNEIAAALSELSNKILLLITHCDISLFLALPTHTAW